MAAGQCRHHARSGSGSGCSPGGAAGSALPNRGWRGQRKPAAQRSPARQRGAVGRRRRCHHHGEHPATAAHRAACGAPHHAGSDGRSGVGCGRNRGAGLGFSPPGGGLWPPHHERAEPHLVRAPPRATRWGGRLGGGGPQRTRGLPEAGTGGLRLRGPWGHPGRPAGCNGPGPLHGPAASHRADRGSGRRSVPRHRGSVARLFEERSSEPKAAGRDRAPQEGTGPAARAGVSAAGAAAQAREGQAARSPGALHGGRGARSQHPHCGGGKRRASSKSWPTPAIPTSSPASRRCTGASTGGPTSSPNCCPTGARSCCPCGSWTQESS